MNLTKFEHYVSRLTPNIYPLNAILIARNFHRTFGRFPRKPTHPDADYHDFLVDRMARNGWNELHRKCVDKEHAKAVALELAPDVKVPATIEVIPTQRGISIGYLKERLAPYIGKRLVAKPTHLWGVILFLDRTDDRQIYDLFLTTRYDHFYSFRETQYHRLPSKVIIEENICDGDDLPDYKFFCANGSILFVQIDFGRFFDHKRLLLMSPDFKPSDGVRLGPFDPPASWQRPEQFDEMIRIASQLSRPFDFVRVDLYSTSRGIFFGEFTFTPGAGLEPFSIPTFSKVLLKKMTLASIE